MSANPGGGDFLGHFWTPDDPLNLRESPSEATMSNEHATIEALRLKVEYWQDRALAAEADAATLSKRLAARATVRHNLDPTQP